MAYTIMLRLISLNRKSKEELLNMADVYFAAGRLNADQYTEIVEKVNALEE